MRGPSRIPPARDAALAALDLTLAAPGKDVQAALDQVLKQTELDERDRALTTELVYGTLRLGHRLRYVLSVFLRDPEGLPDAAMRILLVAAYEILHLKIPDYASVNWAVDRFKEAGMGKLAGLCNAVLRKVAGLGNEVHEIRWYGPDADDPAVLSRYWSCPEWIVRLWLDDHGRTGAERLLRAQVLPPPLGLVALGEEEARRLAGHPALMERHGMGFVFPAGTDLAGLLGPGDQSQVVRLGFAGRKALLGLGAETWVESGPGPVWDACAGRGGKTRVLTELGLEVLATDVHQGRIRALKREQPGVRAEVRSLLDGPPEGGPFPTVLVDAPCTGLGVLSRRPDIKWKRRPKDAEALVRAQAAMLDAAWQGVAPGGRLAYLTCTLNRAENQDQAEAFLTRTPGARLELDHLTPSTSQLGEFFYGAVFRR